MLSSSLNSGELISPILSQNILQEKLAGGSNISRNYCITGVFGAKPIMMPKPQNYKRKRIYHRPLIKISQCND